MGIKPKHVFTPLIKDMSLEYEVLEHKGGGVQKTNVRGIYK